MGLLKMESPRVLMVVSSVVFSLLALSSALVSENETVLTKTIV
jgi:hypothetical protein